MPIGILFWFLMILWLILGLYTNWPLNEPHHWAAFGSNLLQFILFGLLGWQVFGPVLQRTQPPSR